MKILIKSAIIAGICILAAVGANAQSTLNRPGTWSLTGSNQTFTFTQFDSTLGTLNAVDFILNSASVNGTASITNNVGGDTLVSALLSRIRVENTGFTSFILSSSTTLNSSPGSLTLAVGATQPYTVTSTSLIGSPLTRSIGSGSLSSYIGSGNTPNFTARLVNTSSNDAGGDLNLVQLYNFTAPNTSVTLRYTYTPGTAPVPEVGQVAASLLLLGGIGGYVFIKRRRKSSVAAA
jgi:hypothetical protein